MNWKNCLARQRKEDKYDDKFGFVGMMEMKLNEICEVYSGYALKKFNDGEDGIPVIKIGNIRIDGTLNLETCQYTTEGVDKKYYSNRGDVYIALSGATTGKVGIMDTDDLYVINQRVGIVRQKTDDIPQEYIKNFLLRQTDRILKEATGCAQPNISPKQIAEYIVPDISKEKMYEICVIFNKIKKIINDRNAEISALDNLIKARFVELFGDPMTNPKGYPVRVLSEVAEYWNGLTYKPEDVANEGTIVLRSSNIQDATLDFKDTVRVSCEISDKKYVMDNDILMCSRNGSARLVGKVALIRNLDEPMSFGAFMMIIRSAYYSYLMTYFQMPAFRAQITTGATTTINQITGKILDAVKLPVPDLYTINEFSDFVNQVDKSKFVYY